MAAGRSLWRLIWVSITLALEVVLLVNGNAESDALYKLKQNLTDPNNLLSSWDPYVGTPCAWTHIYCTDGNVTGVDLGSSNLSGNLVPELGTLHYLLYLKLSNNQITGTIPVELGNLKNLMSMDLEYNQLSGPIPTSFGNLQSLISLRLNDNKLTGPIPPELQGVASLKAMNFSNNDLCGPVPSNGSFWSAPMTSFLNNPRLIIKNLWKGAPC